MTTIRYLIAAGRAFHSNRSTFHKELLQPKLYIIYICAPCMYIGIGKPMAIIYVLLLFVYKRIIQYHNIVYSNPSDYVICVGINSKYSIIMAVTMTPCPMALSRGILPIDGPLVQRAVRNTIFCTESVYIALCE